MADMDDMDIVKRIKEIVPLGETRKVSYLAKRIKVPVARIRDVTEGTYAGLDLIVGIQIPGLGIAQHKMSDYEVEHYE